MLSTAQPKPRPRLARESHPSDVAPGYCLCGCGNKTNVIRYADASKGLIAGQPRRYLKGHEHKAFFEGMIERHPESGCWNWLGTVDVGGYGRVGGRLVFHESYRSAKGEVPEGKQLDHLCRNRRCVNPDHLEAVTPAWNSRRGKQTKLVASDVIEIRRAVARGESRASVARRFGISAQYAGDIVAGKKWAVMP